MVRTSLVVSSLCGLKTGIRSLHAERECRMPIQPIPTAAKIPEPQPTAAEMAQCSRSRACGAYRREQVGCRPQAVSRGRAGRAVAAARRTSPRALQRAAPARAHTCIHTRACTYGAMLLCGHNKKARCAVHQGTPAPRSLHALITLSPRPSTHATAAASMNFSLNVF